MSKYKYLFVYDQFMTNHEHNLYIKDLKLASPDAFTENKFELLIAGALRIPCMKKNVLSKNRQHIHGELYDISENKKETLKMTDDIMGHPYVFERDIIAVRLMEGEVVLAYVYFRNDVSGEIIPSGSYNVWCQEQEMWEEYHKNQIK